MSLLAGRAERAGAQRAAVARSVRALATAMVLTAAAAPASATSYYSEGFALAYVRTPGLTVEDIQGPTSSADPGISLSASASFTPRAAASIAVSGSSAVGTLRASAIVSSLWLWDPFDPSDRVSGYFPEASGRARVAWRDDITILGPTGGTALLNIIVDLSSSLSGAGGDWGYGRGSVGVESGVALTPGDFVYYSGPSASYDTVDGIFGTPTGGQVIPVTVTAGQRVGLTSLLTVQATARQGGTMTVDGGHTGRMFLEFVTPGFSYLSDSGHDFSRSVPEPGAGLLVAIGLAALARRRAVRSAR